MSTNYYYYPTGKENCPHCGQEAPRLHIGKSACGWNFSLRIHPDRGINSLEDWRAFWWMRPKGVILDEYGTRVTVGEMLSIIAERSHPKGLKSMRDVETVGPYWQHLDIRPGAGTYDLCNYEFS